MCTYDVPMLFVYLLLHTCSTLKQETEKRIPFGQNDPASVIRRFISINMIAKTYVNLKNCKEITKTFKN